MNNSTSQLESEMAINEPTPVSPTREGEAALPKLSEEPQKLIPRNQNKMVAERTTDMFLSGLMSE